MKRIFVYRLITGLGITFFVFLTQPVFAEDPLPTAVPAVVPVVSGADLVQVSTGKTTKTTYSASYLASELGRLSAEIESMKTGSGANKTVGYDGGFFIKSDDGLFLFNITGAIKGKYAFNLAEQVGSSHSFLMSAPTINFNGTAFSAKSKYLFNFNTGSAVFLSGVDWQYVFHPAFALHFWFQAPAMSITQTTSGGKLSFVSRSIASLRNDYGKSLQVGATGQVKWFSYLFGVSNGINSSLSVNANNEVSFLGRLDFAILGKAYGPGEGDINDSQKPNLVAGIAGVFGYDETGVQARIIAGAGDVQFQYKRFSLTTSGFYRQTDPDQFTRAQTDVGLLAQISYFVIPKKLELAVRGSAIIDDITSAYLNTNTAMVKANFSGLDGVWAGGDITGDSANEYEGSVCLGYYFLPKFNTKIQAQYTLMLDGVAGASSLLNHIGVVQVQMAF